MARVSMSNSSASSSTLPRLLNPGVLDRNQNQRIRRHPESIISFASFDPHTATSDLVLPELEQLSLKAELNRSTRVVIETLPSGVSTWRFVPKAQKAEGIPDEGTWPRVVEIFGSYFLCSQEQWDIFKLDPLYHCYIRLQPACPLITKRVEQPFQAPHHVPHKNDGPASPLASQSRNRARFQTESDSEEEQDEVEGMIIDDEQPIQKSTGPSLQEKQRKRGKVDRKTRREKTARRTGQLSREDNLAGSSKAARFTAEESAPGLSKFTFDSTSDGRAKSAPAQPGPGKRKVNFLFDTLQTNDGHCPDDICHTDDTPPKDAAAAYTTSRKKKARTVSPDEIRKTLRAKRAAIRQQRQEQRKREFEMRRMDREETLLREALMSDVEMPDAALMEPPQSQGTVEMNSPSPECQEVHEADPFEEKTPVPDDFVDDDKATHAARIEQSRRKMAELEKDRPLWNAAAARRMEQQQLEEEALRREAAERRARKAQRENEERVKREDEERAKKEEAAQAQRQMEIQSLIDRENKRRQRLQQMFHYWSSAAWSATLALDRYRTLLHEFGQAKFIPGVIPLRTCDIPWPVLPREYTLQCVTLEEITKFFDTMRAILSMEDYKDLLKKSSLRFHPDHWSIRLDSVVNEEERRAIAEDSQLDSQPTTALRRSRSTSDIPQRLEPLYGPMDSLSPSDAGDHTLSSRLVEGSPRRYLGQAPVTTGRRSPSLIVTSGSPTHTLGPYHRSSQDYHNDASFVRNSAPPRRRSTLQNITLALGFGRGASRRRRSLVEFILNLISGSSQVIIATIILALSGTRFKSPTDPELTEWAACSRPLGPWACLWVIRAVIATSLNYWGFLRERQLLARRHGRAHSVSVNSEPSRQLDETLRTSPRALENADLTARDQASLPNTLLYSRLTLFSSLLTLSWFLTAHILAYTSISTCRQSSPHIWWLVFGILCLMYLMILEVVVLGFVVFVVAPILFMFWNIFLICMGRHPFQTHNTIKPEIGKISKSIVDSIPLVLYLPPPPDNIPQQQKVSVTRTDNSSSGFALPETKKDFRFMKHLTLFTKSRKGRTSEPQDNKNIEKTREPQTWEEHWEQGEYPFVILEENRAACAICLVDFAEPKRIWSQVKTIECNARVSLEPIKTGEDSNPVKEATPLAVSNSGSQTSNSASENPNHGRTDKLSKN
ncbi:hypothetical protein C0993_002173 [Termitomyces sp. T159_Od127]|nr:hypothetical protein C0993_002173 [Termitomyces sp. T159_Od127]